MTRETLNEITSNISEQRMIKIQKATIPLVIFGLTMVFLNPYMYQSSFNETGWMVWVFLPFVVIVLGTAFIAIWASARKAQHLPPNQVKTPVIRSKQEIIGMFFG